MTTKANVGLFSGGEATSSASSSSGLSQGSVGATLDLSSLQSIQGHTIYDGFQAGDVLSFGDLISQTAQNSSKTTASIFSDAMKSSFASFAESVENSSATTAQGIQDSVSSINSTISGIVKKVANLFTSPVFLAGVGVMVFLFAYKAFKRGR